MAIAVKKRFESQVALQIISCGLRSNFSFIHRHASRVPSRQQKGQESEDDSNRFESQPAINNAIANVNAIKT
ncbi:hypothetical protein Q2T83_01700 [Fervidibacter sacchari]|uniref:Uncharacterized protein n=1 Tax=Candidatus Fervidibacter sacchari TaxID=1448929 RepID=A0ABT2ESZ4_9BACT|nr:hypothetical protein [Candidatus Fervidibacter sacchari]MCS3921093.1 hypothetical protein [Candidatus Fervidibacter sacchari]WKU16552.1 hypothetical protein Q2T83_01700 [Candidatus Fervidibacter sacchari]